jgi:guanylate kinase
MADLQRLTFSVSHTTRNPRENEQDGVDYHFVTVDSFTEMRDAGNFLEWAEVHGNYYGTSRSAVKKQLQQGLDVILDIDIQGAAIIAEDSALAAVTIFVAPPSLAELEKRLRGRGTDTEATIDVRLGNAAQEMAAAEKYDYLVINDELAGAVLTLKSILIAERSRGHRLPTGVAIHLKADK